MSLKLLGLMAVAGMIIGACTPAHNSNSRDARPDVHRSHTGSYSSPARN